MNKKAQTESGPLQKLIIVLLMISVISVLSFSYVTQISQPYSAQIQDDSVFINLSQQQRTVNRTNEIRDTLRNVSGPVDAITGIVTGGYDVLALFLSDIPSDFTIMVDTLTGPGALQLPSIVTLAIITALVIMAIFAVLALVMKIRA